MSLELLAIVLGLHSFLWHLQGKRVRIWTDNTGGEGALSSLLLSLPLAVASYCSGALRRGSSKEEDHNNIVQAVWLLAMRYRVGIEVASSTVRAYATFCAYCACRSSGKACAHR